MCLWRALTRAPSDDNGSTRLPSCSVQGEQEVGGGFSLLPLHVYALVYYTKSMENIQNVWNKITGHFYAV